MDWPHDPDGELGSEGRRVYGHAVLVKTVSESTFPIAVEAYREEYGSYPVRIDPDTVISVEQILDHVDRDRFESLDAFHRAVGTAMRAGGYWPYERA